jgi:biopolymer transport protein ExbD
MKTKTNKSTVKSEINIAPFTDVVLVLLIIFMITTPALMQPEIQVNLPKAESVDSGNTSTSIEALISQEGKVAIDGKVIDLSELERVIRELLVDDPTKSIVIKGDVKVDYGHVMQFMDKAKKAGATKFALAVETK